MARLECTAQAISLPARLRSEIKWELQRLELVIELIATLEAERDAIVEDAASTHINAKKIRDLHKLKAIGPEFPWVLVGEIFRRNFSNRRQLASDVGYAPSLFQSRNVAHDQRISKAGNRKGRTTGIELAWLWLRYQPGTDLSAWFQTRVGATKGHLRCSSWDLMRLRALPRERLGMATWKDAVSLLLGHRVTPLCLATASRCFCNAPVR